MKLRLAFYVCLLVLIVLVGALCFCWGAAYFSPQSKSFFQVVTQYASTTASVVAAIIAAAVAVLTTGRRMSFEEEERRQKVLQDVYMETIESMSKAVPFLFFTCLPTTSIGLTMPSEMRKIIASLGKLNGIGSQQTVEAVSEFIGTFSEQYNRAVNANLAKTNIKEVVPLILKALQPAAVNLSLAIRREMKTKTNEKCFRKTLQAAHERSLSEFYRQMDYLEQMNTQQVNYGFVSGDV